MVQLSEQDMVTELTPNPCVQEEGVPAPPAAWPARRTTVTPAPLGCAVLDLVVCLPTGLSRLRR